MRLLVLLCEYQGQYNSRTEAALQMGKIVIQWNLKDFLFLEKLNIRGILRRQNPKNSKPENIFYNSVLTMTFLSLAYWQWHSCHWHIDNDIPVTVILTMTFLSLAYWQWHSCHWHIDNDTPVTGILTMTFLSLAYWQWHSCHWHIDNDIPVTGILTTFLSLAYWQWHSCHWHIIPHKLCIK